MSVRAPRRLLLIGALVCAISAFLVLTLSPCDVSGDVGDRLTFVHSLLVLVSGGLTASALLVGARRSNAWTGWARLLAHITGALLAALVVMSVTFALSFTVEYIVCGA